MGAIKNPRGVLAAGRWYSRETPDQLIAIAEPRDGASGTGRSGECRAGSKS